MGQTGSTSAEVQGMLKNFLSVIDEPWEDSPWSELKLEGAHTRICSRVSTEDLIKQAPLGDRESGNVRDLVYWRGIVEVTAPVEIVLWFLRNQYEYDNLWEYESTLRKAVPAEVYKCLKQRTMQVLNPNARRTSPLRMNTIMEMPPPVSKREFRTLETVQEIDGRWVIVQKTYNYDPESAVLEKGSQGLPGQAGRGSHSSFTDSVKSIRNTLIKATQSGKDKKNCEEDHGHGWEEAAASRRVSASGLHAARPTKIEKMFNFNSTLGAVEAGEVVVSGCTLDRLAGARTRVSYLVCIDPALSMFKNKGVPKELTPFVDTVEQICGMGQILLSSERMVEYFSQEMNVAIERLYRLASADVGDLNFAALQGKGKAVKTGTHIVDKQLGAGVVTQFDMMGNTIVKYDQGNEQCYNEKQMRAKRLEAVLEVGSRVVHPDYGKGIVNRIEEEGTIHVVFDTGVYHRLSEEDQSEMFASDANVTAINGLGKVTMSYRNEGIYDTEPVNKLGQTATIPVYRISFTLQASTADVVEFLKNYNQYKHSGLMIEEKVLKADGENHETVIYRRQKSPKPLDDRDFVFAERVSLVDKDCYVLVQKSVEKPQVELQPRVVRGEVVLRGFLVEPVDLNKIGSNIQNIVRSRLNGTLTKKKPDYARVTYVCALDLKGFVPPKTEKTEAMSEVIGVLADIRARFLKEDKSGVLNNNRGSKHSLKHNRVLS